MNDIRAVTGDNIRFFRENLGITIEELSFRVGSSYTYIGEAERGKRNMTIIKLQQISKGLYVEPYRLLMPDPLVDATQEINLLRDYFESFARLPTKRQERIAPLLRNLLALEEGK